jgi:hypothetical protein
MDDINHKKDLAALEQLEREKDRRIQAKIDSGEVVSVPITVVVGRNEDAEEAVARALANLPASIDGRAVHPDLTFIVTGVPRRDPDEPSPKIETASSEEPSRPSEEPAASIGPPIPRSEPEYIFVTTRQATDAGDPGAIAEALWSVEDGAVVLTDLGGRHISGRALLKGQDPAAVARALLREAEEPKSFNHPISHPKLGLA